METRQEVLRELNYDHCYREKIKKEFSFNLPRNEKAELMYHALVKEQKLYLCYATAAAALFKAFWDFNDSTKRVVPLVKEWERCTLEGSNYHSFTQLTEHFFTQEDIIKKPIDKWRTNFSLLFADPAKLDNDLRNEMLLFFCRINAFHSLRLFFKLHYPAVEINLPGLLREAIGCLHSESAQTLLESGANISDYFYTTAYQDDGIFLFMPPLYYAVWSPYDNYATLHRDGPKISWDNSKLQNMIKTLLAFGADPKQNCLAAPWSGNKGISAPDVKDKQEINENTISLISEIIKNQTSKLNKESLDFLNSITGLKQQIDLNTQHDQTAQHISFSI